MPDSTERVDAPVRGLWCATLTPLRARGTIDHARLASHVRRLFDAGIDGIVMFGTTGEGPSFAVGERRAALERLLAAGIAPDRIVVATGCTAAPDTEALVRHALNRGVQRCLILPPYFWKDLNREAVYRYYSGLIERIGNPAFRLYLYHYPQVSGVSIDPSTLAKLARDYPSLVAGLKDSGGDFTQTQRFLAAAPDLSILVGHETDLPRSLANGGTGTICGAANLFPRLVRTLFDPDTAADGEARLEAALQILARCPFVPAFKAVLARQTADAAWARVRTPLLPLPIPEAQEICRALAEQELLKDPD
jgi:4-hydroxy-tetrahydrodipicolinate synthase